MTKKIKLMADYRCYPLWWENSPQVGNINPATLPLSQETVHCLEKWAATYDSSLNLDDPAASGFLTNQEREAFEQEGIRLWKKLRQELSYEYEVSYFSQLQRQIL